MTRNRQRSSGQEAKAESPAATVKTPAKDLSVLGRISPRTWLILILCLAAFLRFYQITTVPSGIQVDEAMNGSNILEILETCQIQVFYPENVGREGLFINIQAPFVYWFGNTPWALRAPSAIFGVLTVWGVYLLAGEMFSTSIGLLAAFFVATSYWHVHFSRVGLRAICAPFFLTWGLYFLLAGMRRVASGKPAIGWMVTAGAVYGLGFHTYIAYRTTPALIAGVLLYYFFQARSAAWPGAFWKAITAFAAAAVLVISPLLLYFARNPGTFFGRTTQISIYRTDHPYSTLLLNIWKTAQMFFFEGDTNWRHNYDGQRELFWPVAILFALGTGMALSAIWKKRPRWFSYAVALTWIVLAAIPVVLSDDGVPHALRSILMIPAVFMLAAAGADRAYGYLVTTLPQPARIAGVMLFLLFCCYEPYHTYFDLWANNPNVPPNYSASMVRLAEQFNQMPGSVPRYFALTSTGPSANGIPVMFQPFVYLTRSYTKKQQEETNIHYLTPETYHPQAAGKTFCEQVQASMPGAPVTCVNLRF